jgi:hypothetical protein
MIEMLPESGGNLIAVKMSGTVTEQDQDRYFAQAEAVLEEERIEHLLLDWVDLDGWAKGARTAGTWFGMHHRALVGRVAIIADQKWDDEVMRITDIFRAARVRRFAPSDRGEALDWIRRGE